MFKNLIVIATLVASATAAQASHNCAVAGKSGVDEYNDILTTVDLDLENGRGEILYQSPSFSVAVQRSADGTMHISTFTPETKKVYAIAMSNGSFLTLLDAKNKIVVNCIKK